MPFHIVVRSQRLSVVGSMVFVVVLATYGTALHAQESVEGPRVRSVVPVISAAIVTGIERSTTFRGVVEAIDATDGVVYVQEGRCRRSVRACLHLSVGIAGRYRFLRILVDLGKVPDCEFIASLGHELQHALEVLSDPRIRNWSQMYAFFDMKG